VMEDWLRLARSGCVDIDIFLVTKAMNRDCSRDYSALGLRERSFEDFFASLQLRTLLPGLSSRAHSTRMSSCFLPALFARLCQFGPKNLPAVPRNFSQRRPRHRFLTKPPLLPSHSSSDLFLALIPRTAFSQATLLIPTVPPSFSSSRNPHLGIFQ